MQMMGLSASASLSAGGSAPGAGGLLANGSFPYGLAMRFQVSVDDLQLGHWSSCKGLKVDLKVTKVQDGGNYWYQHLLPDHIEYQNITLERAVHPKESLAVQQWLRNVASTWENGSTYAARSATITLLGADLNPVMNWTLYNVYPVSWTGPTLSATDNKVAIESLELAHEGFLAVPG